MGKLRADAHRTHHGQGVQQELSQAPRSSTVTATRCSLARLRTTVLDRRPRLQARTCGRNAATW